MSRLEEECILYVGRNRSGIDAGEIDYGIFTDKFDRQTVASIKEIILNLDFLIKRCGERILEIESCDHGWIETPDSKEILKFYRCEKCNVAGNP